MSSHIGTTILITTVNTTPTWHSSIVTIAEITKRWISLASTLSIGATAPVCSIRRPTIRGDIATITTVRDLEVDRGAFRATRAGTPVGLTVIEFRLLADLAQHAGEAMTREALLDHVWGYDYLGDSRIVDMAVQRLRAKLGPAPDDTPYITTVRGVGYRLEAS